jgi:hypothetical protein
MALTGTSRGSGTHNTAASSRAVSPSGTIPAGSIAVIVWALDNSGTSGVSRFSSMADSVGNTWSTPLNINKTAGTANDGTTLVMSWSLLTTQLLNTNTITITLTGNVTPKCYAIHQITPAAGNSVEYVTSGSTTGTGNVALTTGTIDNLQMVVCAAANEYGTAQTPTHDTDTTNGSWSTALYAEVGTTGAGQNVASQRKVVTASATQTYNVSYSSSADYAAGWLSFKEVIGGTFAVNAVVSKTVAPTFGVDAVIVAPPITGSFATDAIVGRTQSLGATVDAVISRTMGTGVPTEIPLSFPGANETHLEGEGGSYNRVSDVVPLAAGTTVSVTISAIGGEPGDSWWFVRRNDTGAHIASAYNMGGGWTGTFSGTAETACAEAYVAVWFDRPYVESGWPYQPDLTGAGSWTIPFPGIPADAVIKKNQSGSFGADAVIAKLVWSDDFARVVEEGWGLSYFPQDPNVSVDGSSAVIGAHERAVIETGYTAVRSGYFQIDFWVPADPTTGPDYVYIGFLDLPGDPSFWPGELDYWANGDGTWTVVPWPATGAEVNFTPDASTWYTAKVFWDGTPGGGPNATKVWKSDDPEPDTWGATGTTEHSSGDPFVVVSAGSEPVRFRNLRLWRSDSLPAYVSWSFAVNAVIQATAADQTGFTANALIAVPPFTSDAVIRRTFVFGQWVEGGWVDPGLYDGSGVTLDAVIVGQGYSLTADSLIRREQSFSFAVDAVIDLGMVTEEGSFAADAVALRETSSTLIANAWVEGITTGGFSLDAVKKAGQDGSFTASAIVKKSSTPTYSADAVVFRTAASSFSAAAVISITSASSWPSNAIIKSAASVTFSSDAVARKESTSALSADAVLCKPTSFSFSGDAVARQTAVSGTSADATIQRTSSATPTTNAIIRLGQESSLSADAFVQPWFGADAYISAKLTADAVLRSEQVRTFTAGAWVEGVTTGGFSLDAVIWASRSGDIAAYSLVLRTSSGLEFNGNAITRTGNSSSFALAAILSASSASSISSNAISLASATSTFLCAAVVRSSASWSLSADSLILRPVSTSLSSDSVVLKLTSLSFLADGVARRTPESALAGDAVVLRAIAMDLATNAIVLREQAGWLAADAWIQGSGLAGFSGDAVVRRTVEDSEPLDAIVRRTSQASLATSAIVRRAETLGLTANAVVFSASSGSFTAGACIAGTFTANTVIRKTNTGTATADSVVMPVFVGNAVLRRSQESSFVAGAWVPAQGIFGFGADSALRAVIGQAFSVNAIARIPVSGTLCADAVIAAEQNGAATADAVTQKGETGYLAASAVLVAGRTVGLSANSVLLSPEAGSASADAVLLASRGGTLTSDSTLRASRELPATADAVLRVTGSGSLAADAYILASEAAVLTASAVVLREQLAQFAGHALVNQVVQRGLDADATVQALHVGSLRADAVVQANPERAFQSHAVTLISVTESVNSNSVISASSTNSFSANSWVIDSKRFSTDAVISSSTGFSFPADGIVVLPTALFDAELDLEFLEASLSVDLFEAELTLEYIEASVFVELFEADLQLSLIEATVARAPWLWSAGRFSADAVVEA